MNTAMNIAKNKNPQSGSNKRFFVQRKCNCGSKSNLTGKSPDLEKKKLLGVQPKLRIGAANDAYEQEADRVADQVMRSSSSPHINSSPIRIQRLSGQMSGDMGSSPPSVDRVLSGSGKPLDAPVKQDMEQRFGHNFSQVRIHTDTSAIQSAKDINAHAFTAGHNVVFGEGQYSPSSNRGQHLLAHELTHVVQQSGPTIFQNHNDSIGKISRGEIRVSRQEIRDAGVPLPGGLPNEPEVLPEEDIPREVTPVITKNWAGEVLDPEQRRGLIQFLYDYLGVTPGDTSELVSGATFLLHDTSGASSRTTIEHNAQNAIGPMGSGPNAFIPRNGVEIVQRPDFFDPNRPTTTEFEKGTDILDEAGRETALRAVWSNTVSAQQATATTRALTGIGLSSSQITTISAGVATYLNGASTGLPDGSKSAAGWTVREICTAVGSQGAAAVATSDHSANLTSACTAVAPLLTARRNRIGSTASVELVQVGARRSDGNQNTCNPNNPNNLPLPDPPYSDDQYWNTTLLYLSAAVQAGQFPNITTHFATDAFVGGHCDPRCFDLPRLYSNIAQTLAPLGHGSGSTYGITPSFGLRSGTNNVWWHDATCHGPSP